ncbi:MAG TPA: type II toxin-antitoxin system RelB/DinJ family antitoxin [Patescibacteria group bacterium]|nr:type II toxin-antitoxin system RelB/DinJ family antitoxin [Patescibacteria group bacterium]
MNTAVINVKVDPKVKSKAQNVASELGFSLSSLINGYLKTLIKTGTIYFSLDQREAPSEYMIKALKRSEEDRKAGRYTSFNSVDKAIKYLDNMIDADKKD